MAEEVQIQKQAGTRGDQHKVLGAAQVLKRCWSAGEEAAAGFGHHVAEAQRA